MNMDWIRNLYLILTHFWFQDSKDDQFCQLQFLSYSPVCLSELSVYFLCSCFKFEVCIGPASKSLLSVLFTVNGLNKLLDEVMCYPIHIGWLVHTIWLVVWLRAFSTLFLGKALVCESVRSSKPLISKIRARYGFTDRYQLSCVGYFSYSSCRQGSESPSSPNNIAPCVDWFS
jgi:hypothetical protein